MLGVWVLRKCRKAKGNKFFLILVYSLNIYMIFRFFFFGCVCLVFRCRENVGKQKEIGFIFIFIFFICLVSKKS